MHPLVRGAGAAAVLTALGSFDRGALEPPPSVTPAAEVRGVDGLPAPCGKGTLPEGPVCVRIPGEDEIAAAQLAPARLEDTGGRPPTASDRIPRRPDRPADPAAYVYPVGERSSGSPSKPLRMMGGLDQPGVRLVVRPGEKVLLVALEHQVGPAEVVYAGDLVGRTVVTAHVVEEGARRRTVLLLHGGLDHAAPGVVQGAKLEAGAELGAARTDLGAGLIDVYLEAREVREGARLDAADSKRLLDGAVGVPTDVRNVLPLRL